MLALEDAGHAGECDDVGESKESGLTEAKIERLGELRMTDDPGRVGVSAGVARGLAEAEGDSGGAGGKGLPEIVHQLIG